MIGNYPNPFNGETTIRMQPPIRGQKLNIIITDVLGRQIQNWSLDPVHGQNILLHWDGRTNTGTSLPSGIYMLHVSSGTWQDSHKMILMQ